MKREIKFRGKRLDNGEWITGSPMLIQDADGSWLEDEDLDVVKVDPDTLGQYTGLKDHNWREIYEGDVIYMQPTEYADSFTGKVVYEDAEYFVHIPNTDLYRSLFSATYHRSGVILGNVHDNPELLKNE